jgi:hypothetical protein
MIPMLRWLVILVVLSSGSLRDALAQTSADSSRLMREWPWPAGVLVVESVAFGSAALARSETGARVVGSIQGISGLAVVSIAAFTDRETGSPEFLVPYGVGLLSLAYYNFRNAESPRQGRRFWFNAIGLNVAVLAGVLSDRLFGPHSGQSTGALERVGPTFAVSIPF